MNLGEETFQFTAYMNFRMSLKLQDTQITDLRKLSKWFEIDWGESKREKLEVRVFYRFLDWWRSNLVNAEEISLKKYKELNMQMLYLWKIQIGSGLGTAYAAVASLLGGCKQFSTPVFMPHAVPSHADPCKQQGIAEMVVWVFQGQVLKRYCDFVSSWVTQPGKESCSALRTLRELSGELHVEGNCGPPANSQRHLASWEWATLEGNAPAPVRPSDDYSPWYHPDCHFMRDPEAGSPTQATVRFLICRNCMR